MKINAPIFELTDKNNMTHSSIKQKLNKIQELVERGEAGEQENARVLYERLLLEYNLTPDDLINTEQTLLVMFEYSDSYEKKLLSQIIAKVLNTDSIKIAFRGNQALIQLTRIEEEEVKELLTIYRSAWQEESNMFFSAFVQKNEIFPETTPEADEDDYETFTKLVNMMRSVKKVTNPQRKNLLAKPLSESL
jgi:hypothetical protein